MDGKIVSFLSNVAAQTCNVCGSTPSRMNDINYVLSRPVDQEAFKYFIPILHAWIRCLEYSSNVAYRLTIKHSNSRYTTEQKDEMAAQKARVKVQLETGLGLKVDRVKSGGFGNTNDGNMARRFFENPQTTAELTGNRSRNRHVFSCFYFYLSEN